MGPKHQRRIHVINLDPAAEHFRCESHIMNTVEQQDVSFFFILHSHFFFLFQINNKTMLHSTYVT